MKAYIYTIIVLLFAFNFLAFGEKKNSLTVFLAGQPLALSQEKVYLQIDRPRYCAGERIWFSAYVVDAALHHSVTGSPVYVEVIDRQGTVVSRVLVRTDSLGGNGGYILQDEKMKEGNYTLRGYTERMKSLGDDYFFKRAFDVYNPEAPVQEAKANADYAVSFFPEGGQLLTGVNMVVAFKAVNQNGWSEEISGTVEDEDGNVLQKFHTEYQGMGKFYLKPEKDKKYYAVCTSRKGVIRRYTLPDVQDHAFALQARWQRNRLAVSVAETGGQTGNRVLSLLIHHRGMVLYHQAYNRKVLFFDKDSFPSGIIHILALGPENRILSERLVFNRNRASEASVTFTTDAKQYATRERVVSTVSITDTDGAPLRGTFSVSVTDDKDVTADSTVSILSTLLLTSELKGYVEYPAGYFKDETMETVQDRDLLMMTQGWRRYDIPKVIRGDIEQPDSFVLRRQRSVSGKVERLFVPLKHTEVALLANMRNGSELRMTTTDVKGRFVFDDLDFPDSTLVTLQAVSKRNSADVYLSVDDPVIPRPIQGIPQPVILNKNEGVTAYIAKAKQQYTNEHGMRVFELPEVSITAAKRSKSTFYSPIHASMVMDASDIKKSKVRTLNQLLMRLPYVQARLDSQTNEILIKQRGREVKANVIVNEFPIPYFTPDLIDVNEIKEIFALTNSATIVITAERGMGKNNPPQHIRRIDFLGYQQPIEFYSPKYETEEDKLRFQDLRTTVYWNPNIQADESGNAGFDFYTADPETTYSVVIEGITDEGKIIHHLSTIGRKNKLK